MLDSLHVMEAAMTYFYLRATQLRQNGGSPALIRENYIQAVEAAAKVAPFRHPRLSAIRVAGDVNAQVGLTGDEPLEVLRAEFMKHWEKLQPVLELTVSPEEEGPRGQSAGAK
jgi:hypothetical protein